MSQGILKIAGAGWEISVPGSEISGGISGIFPDTPEMTPEIFGAPWGISVATGEIFQPFQDG
jgi:hypothetical protein